MTTQIMTDWANRIHFEQTDNPVLNCYLVELPPFTPGPILIHSKDAGDLTTLWPQVVATIKFLREQPRPFVRIAPPEWFDPFAVVTAANFEDVARDHEVKMLLMTGAERYCDDKRYRERVDNDPVYNDNGLMQQRFVENLVRAWHLLNGSAQPLYKSAIDWSSTEH